jgi:hypothetical protein
MIDNHRPLVAGVAYGSGREPGGGIRFMEGSGNPELISGFTTTLSPVNRLVAYKVHSSACLLSFFQKPFGLR